MEKVRRLIGAGAPISDAIKVALKNEGFETVTAFAEYYGRGIPRITQTINATRRPCDADLKALIAVLGGTDIEWRILLHEAARPKAISG